MEADRVQHGGINTDDHLRNHGFLLTPTGWRLAPLYDVNPVPSGDRLSNVSEYDNTIDLELALEVADYFGLALRKRNRLQRRSAKQYPDTGNSWPDSMNSAEER